MSIITYPLDGKYYNAQDAETYLCTRTSGVFSEDISFTPNGMNITVSPFLAWIKNDDFSGKSVAVTTDTTLTISPSEPILSRIDRIVLRFDARKNGSELMVLKGTPSSSPAVPSISRTPVIYDLCLCQISVKPSATSISAGDITSTLLDESLCGIMRDGVTGIPTLQLQSQAQALLRELEVAISMAENGSPVLQSLGIKRGTVDVTIGTEGQKMYTSGAVPFDVAFLDTPTVVVSRRGHNLNEYVYKYIKPQESVSVSADQFTLNVFSESDISATQTLRYNWIAIGRVEWENGDTGGGEEEPEVEYFNIRTTVSPEGTGTTTGAGNYAKGSTVTLNATPASGYAFEGWYIGSSKITSNASYNITVTSDTIYTAKFVEEVPMITVTVTTDPVGAGSVSGAGTYPKGSTVRLTASPGDRYRFIGWYSGDSKVSPNTEYSVTLNASMAYVAKFEEEVVTPDYYTIITKVSPTGAGSTTGGGQYAAGTSVKLTATANEGYLFSHWSKGTETRATAEITVEATTDQTWTANFIEGEEDTEEKVTITINVEPEGAGTVAGNGEVNSGVMSAIQATANSGYKFKHWRFENGTTNEANPYLFKASADRTFVAVFEVDSGEEETTYTKDTWVGSVLYVGTEETKIETDNAYSLDLGLTEVIIPEGRTQIAQLVFSDCSNLAKVTMPSTMTIIGANAFDGCSSLTEITYNGTKSQWNNISKNSAFDGDLNDITIHCTDGDINYVKMTISVSPEGSGSVTTSPTAVTATTGDTFYVEDSTVRLTAVPSSGYRFKQWTKDGEWASNNITQGFTAKANSTITAVFEEENYTVTTRVSPTGAGSTTGGGQYAAGTVVKLTATANEGYLFSHWSKGTETRATAEITVEATTDQTWTANFIEGEEDTEEKVTITINVEPEGAGTVAGNGEVNSGVMSAIQATANSGYKFKHWRFENGTTNEANPYLFKASADRTFVAVFEVENLVITISPEGAGEVTITEGETYEWGTTKTLEAIPASGYRFSHWLLANTTEYTENPHQIVVREDSHYDFTAVFEQETTTETKNIEIRCGGSNGGTTEIKRNGVVVHDSGDMYSDTFNYGEEVTLTAKFDGDNSETFNDWEDDETGRILSTSNPYTFTVGSDTPNKICMGLRSA